MKSNNQRLMNTLRNGFTGVISQFFIILIGFVLRAIFIKTLGQEYLGLNGLFTDILSILSVTELGIGSTITFSLYKPLYEEDYKTVNSLMHIFKRAYRLIGSVILVVSIALLPFIQIFIKDFSLDLNQIRIFFMLFSINTVLSYFLGYNRIIFFAKQKNYMVLWIDFIFKLILSISQIYLLIVYKNFILHISVMILYTLITNLIIHRLALNDNPYLKNKPDKLEPIVKDKLIHSLKYLSIATLIGVGVLGTDRIIISSFIGISVLGLYSNYSMIIQQVTTLFTTLLNGVTASLGDLVAEGETEKIHKVFKIYNFGYFIIASFTTVSFYTLLTPFITDIWLSSEYAISSLIVGVVVANSYMFFLRQPVWQFQNTAGVFKEYLPFSILEFVINLVISIYGAMNYGIIGVFFGSFFAYIVSWSGQSYKLHKHVFRKPVFEYYQTQVLYIVIVLIELGIVIFINTVVKLENNYLAFGLRMIWAAFIPNGINLVFFRKNPEFVYLKETLFKRFLKNSQSEPIVS